MCVLCNAKFRLFVYQCKKLINIEIKKTGREKVIILLNGNMKLYKKL